MVKVSARMLWGRDTRTASKGIRLLGLVLAVGVVVAAVTAWADVYLPEPTETVFRTAVAPSRLPAHKATPVSLLLAERIRNLDESHPPPLQELHVDLDRHLSLSVKGLPSCPRPLGGRQSRRNPFEACEEAKVGSGIVELDVAFPEQQPVQISGQLSAYNGGVRKGRTLFWLFVYFPAPVTGGIFIPLEVRHHSQGSFGWTGKAEFPKIANEAGSVTSLRLRFEKGVFAARCPTSPLQGRMITRFRDGLLAQSLSTQACRTAGASG